MEDLPEPVRSKKYNNIFSLGIFKDSKKTYVVRKVKFTDKRGIKKPEK